MHCYYPITPHLSTLGSIQCFSDQDSAFSFKQLLQFFMLVHMGMWSPQSKSVRQTYTVRNITHGVITRRRLGRRGDRSKATTERKVMSIGAIMVAEHFSTPQLQIARRRALSRSSTSLMLNNSKPGHLLLAQSHPSPTFHADSSSHPPRSFPL